MLRRKQTKAGVSRKPPLDGPEVSTHVEIHGSLTLVFPMRHSHFDPAAKKQTVSLTVNGDLYKRAKIEGINASQVAEDALSAALARRLSAKIRMEIDQDLAAYAAYVKKHGSPAQMLRDHLAQTDDAV